MEEEEAAEKEKEEDGRGWGGSREREREEDTSGAEEHACIGALFDIQTDIVTDQGS